MTSIRYNKLIRDRIPEIIEKSGKQSIVQRVERDQLLELLNKKLFEELKEYNESGEIEELAVLVEVVQAILEHKGAEQYIKLMNCFFNMIKIKYYLRIQSIFIMEFSH